MKLVQYLLLLSLLPDVALVAQSADPTILFAEGSNYYVEAQAAETGEHAQELYALAIQTWSRLKESAVSANLHYNLGNAYFNMGETGLAALEYERAMVLEPGHAEARTNLNYILQANGVEPRAQSTLDQLAYNLTMNTWIWLSAVCFWLLVGLLIIPRLYGGPTLFSRIGIILSATILLFSLAATYDYVSKRNNGIVIHNDSPLKVAPAEGSQPLAYVQAGTDAYTDQMYQNYYYIETSQGDAGWISRENYARIWPE